MTFSDMWLQEPVDAPHYRCHAPVIGIPTERRLGSVIYLNLQRHQYDTRVVGPLAVPFG